MKSTTDVWLPEDPQIGCPSQAYCGLHTDNIIHTSRDLANLIQPLLGKTEHHTENSQELVKKMTGLKVKEGESFVSYDVSLFTKTPIKETCEVIREILDNDKILNKRTGPHSRQHHRVVEIRDGDYVLQIWRIHLPAEVWCSHGQSSIPHCCELVHGGRGEKNIAKAQVIASQVTGRGTWMM